MPDSQSWFWSSSSDFNLTKYFINGQSLKKITYESLIHFHREILKKVGLDKETMEAVTLGLCETSLRGVDSHGIRLLPHYVNSALSGRKNPKPNYTFTKKFPTIGLLDADNTFGHDAGMKAIDYCIEIAEELASKDIRTYITIKQLLKQNLLLLPITHLRCQKWIDFTVWPCQRKASAS